MLHWNILQSNQIERSFAVIFIAREETRMTSGLRENAFPPFAISTDGIDHGSVIKEREREKVCVCVC